MGAIFRHPVETKRSPTNSVFELPGSSQQRAVQSIDQGLDSQPMLHMELMDVSHAGTLPWASAQCNQQIAYALYAEDRVGNCPGVMES